MNDERTTLKTKSCHMCALLIDAENAEYSYCGHNETITYCWNDFEDMVNIHYETCPHWQDRTGNKTNE